MRLTPVCVGRVWLGDRVRQVPDPRRWRFAAGGLLAAAAVAGAACGGGGGASSPAAPTGTAMTIAVVANNGRQSFSPNPAPVGGQMAVWRNDHGETHRMVANDGSFDTGELVPGATSGTVTLPAGVINYHCSIHPTMIGSIGGEGGELPPCPDGDDTCY